MRAPSNIYLRVWSNDGTGWTSSPGVELFLDTLSDADYDIWCIYDWGCAHMACTRRMARTSANYERFKALVAAARLGGHMTAQDAREALQGALERLTADQNQRLQIARTPTPSEAAEDWHPTSRNQRIRRV